MLFPVRLNISYEQLQKWECFDADRGKDGCEVRVLSLTITLAATLAVDVISNGIVRALYRPLFDTMEKLNK